MSPKLMRSVSICLIFHMLESLVFAILPVSPAHIGCVYPALIACQFILLSWVAGNSNIHPTHPRGQIQMMRATLSPFFGAFPPKPRRISKLPLSFPTTATTFFSRPPTVCTFASLTSPPPPTSAYIHLPFCRKRCHYCDFPIIALGATISSSYDDDPRVSKYIALVLREIAAQSAFHPPLQTIFFGGGTPSLVPPRLVADIMDALRVKFGIAASPEVSIEMDPGTFDAGRLDELVALGVNRVSLGVQAFQEELLRSCGRAHGLREVRQSIETVNDSRLDNWSLDLISSLPHQTPEMWAESLCCAVDAQPTHISVYDLQVEQGTKFSQLYTPGEFPLPTEMQAASLYKMASKTLTDAGYKHYEISSYSRSDDYRCKHNLAYWQNKSFYAFGLGSASYLNGVRFSRPRRLSEYSDYVKRLEAGLVDRSSGEGETKDMALDVAMLSLRTADGIDLNGYSSAFGASLALSLCRAYRPYVESGHVIAMDDERRVLSQIEFQSQLSDDLVGERSKIRFIRLSDPEGFLLSNELISIAFGVISP